RENGPRPRAAELANRSGRPPYQFPHAKDARDLNDAQHDDRPDETAKRQHRHISKSGKLCRFGSIPSPPSRLALWRDKPAAPPDTTGFTRREAGVLRNALEIVKGTERIAGADEGTNGGTSLRRGTGGDGTRTSGRPRAGGLETAGLVGGRFGDAAQGGSGE